MYAGARWSAIPKPQPPGVRRFAGRDERELWTAIQTIASVASKIGLYVTAAALLQASSHGLGGAAMMGAATVTVMIGSNIVMRRRSRGQEQVTLESLMERLRE